MNKALKTILCILIAVVIFATGAGGGILLSAKLLSVKEVEPEVDVEKLYNDYLNSEEAGKYYTMLNYSNQEISESLRYSGKKDVDFIDIDGDGTVECFLTVHYAYENQGGKTESHEKQVHLFDIDGEKVRYVSSSGGCAVFRAYEKYRVIQNEDGSFRIVRFITDANKLIYGSVYSYNGQKLELVKSFWADIYPLTGSEKTYYLSSKTDLFDLYKDDDQFVKQVDNLAEKVDEFEFYRVYNYYTAQCKTLFLAPTYSESK